MRLFGRPLSLVILDVDGVIVDLESKLQKNLESVAIGFGLEIKPISEHLNDLKVGNHRGFSNTKDAIKFLYPKLSDIEAQRFVRYVRDKEIINPYSAIPESKETIEWLREKDIPMALCTTNDFKTLVARMDSCGISLKNFSVWAVWESTYCKPDPRVFDLIFDAIPVPKSQSVFVGDWYTDIDAAKGAGVPFIAALSGGVSKEAFLKEGIAEDHIIARLSDLKNLIEF